MNRIMGWVLPANGSMNTINHAANTNAKLHNHKADSAVPYGINSAFSCSTNYSMDDYNSGVITDVKIMETLIFILTI